MENIIKKIKDHPQFIFADSDDELISIIDDVNPGLSHGQKFEIIGALEKLGRSGSRKGSRKGQDFTIDGIKNTAKAFNSATSGETKQNIKNAVKQNDQRVEQNRRESLTQDQRDAEDNLKAAQERIRKEKNDAEVDRLYDQMKGSRKGSTVQQIIEAFDRDYVPHGELIRMAKELPDGLGDRVLIGLGAGSWRGDTPEEEEFFRIIDSKRSRNGSSVRKGTGPLCDLGSISGKGSRPENLGSIASKVSLGRNRSINMDGEYVEQESREGSRKGGNVTFKDVIDYFENLQETSPKDDDELWDEALNHFGVTTDLGKFDSSEFATYYYGSGIKSTNPIPDDMMV